MIRFLFKFYAEHFEVVKLKSLPFFKIVAREEPDGNRIGSINIYAKQNVGLIFIVWSSCLNWQKTKNGD